MMGKPENNIEKITCEPGSNCNLLQFSVLRIRVKVRQLQPGSSGPFRVIIRTNLRLSIKWKKAEAIQLIFTT